MDDNTAQATAHSGKLENSPYMRNRVIRALARGAQSQRAIAREFSVSESSIREFRDRHRAEIDDVAKELEKGLDALWITQKVERLEQLQQDLAAIADRHDAEYVRLRADLLRKAAEEIGDIPNKTTLSFEKPVDINLTGIDPGTL